MNKQSQRDLTSSFSGSDAGSFRSGTPEIQTISLPKGGGAIKGIEEKFEISAVTGGSSFSIPLPLSPSRQGFIPALALTYQSGAGNSPFGLGWQLPVPSITRKTEGGLPRYNDASESDTFILAGAEDLVPVLEKQADGSWEKQPGSQTLNGQSYRISYYRPRIEGLFARIEKWTNSVTGEAHWKTIDRNNLHSFYGLSAGSRVSDPEDASRVFEWLLCRTHDDKGNIILYHYKTEDFSGIAGDLNEKNRIGNCTQLYLKQVWYGNKQAWYTGDDLPPKDGFMFRVVFDYGEHGSPGTVLKDIDEEKSPWICRDDPFSSYRPGFEIRTYRRCNRVLVFHCFDELPHAPYLSRSLELFYDEKLPVPGSGSDTGGFSLLMRARQNGHLWDPAGQFYRTKFLPETEFGYQQHEWNTEIKPVSTESLVHAPTGLADKRYVWIDLFSEGISGILTEQQGGWYYKSNRGDGDFSAARPVAPAPSFSGIGSGKVSIQELEGNGVKYLVQTGMEPRGFFRLADEEEWEPMKSFVTLPNIDQTGSSVRSIDLDGDGRPDLLIAGEGALQVYLSAGEKGFEVSGSVVKELEEENGPAIIFSDPEQSIFLADMSGDGLTDIVRIRNGGICYWPNLGYGRFGAKVTMDHAPLFDHPDAFNPAFLRLADLDGSGTTDIAYLGNNDLRIWMNLHGNAWLAEPLIMAIPQTDNLADVAVLDFLGSGTACLVCSSPLNSQPMHYIDLMGSKKPCLLSNYRNNCGKEVSLEYQSSTSFYLQDEREGHPWITKLPFPVHCISRVRTEDKIRETVFKVSYRYRHGYYDQEEREFRGFARVEQVDTEDFTGFKLNEARNVVEEPLHQSPVRTISWFHTGAMLRNKKIIHQCEAEYFKNGDFDEYAFPEPELPEGLNPTELREAFRACKGVPLRTEVYADDGTDKSSYPYSASQSSVEVRLVQPQGENSYASFQVLSSESASYSYDRNPSDPRITQSFVLEADRWGHVTKSCTVVYPRAARPLGAMSIPDKVWDEQKKMHIAYAEVLYTPEDIIEDDTYRLRIAYESKTYEIGGIAQPPGFFFGKWHLQEKIALAGLLSFEEDFGTGPQKRLSAHSRVYFYKDDLSGPLPLGELSALSIPCKTVQLAYTEGMISKYYGTRVTDQMLSDAKYIHSEGDEHWWTQSGETIFPADPRDHFYIPSGSRDVFGNESYISYDPYSLLTISTTDAIGNVSTAVNDYRTLSPVMLTDPNLNRSAVETDELGLVIRSAVMGKEGAGEGDTLSAPTTRIEYDLFNWRNSGKPNFVHHYTREKHGDDSSRWQESYVYADGSGGVIMTKTQAAPGKAKRWNTARCEVEEVDAEPRWIGNGRTILNNKGNPVKQYEPYFSTTFEYEKEDALVETGVTSIVYYDPLGRNIRTEAPDGTFTKAEFDAWHSKSYDAHDTVMGSQWYADRGSPDPSGPEPSDTGSRAAWLAVKHDNTPEVRYCDALGRPVYVEKDDGRGRIISAFSETDLMGRFSKVYDQLGRNVAENYVNLLGAPVYGDTAEKGKRWVFTDVMGRLVRMWDNDTRELYLTFDALHRPVSTFVKEGSSEILFNHVVYGDLLPEAVALAENRKGRVYQIYDQAGVVTLTKVDFRGNTLEAERRLTREFKQTANWDMLDGISNVSAMETTVSPLLEDEVFTTAAELDALGRPLQVILPDKSVILPEYNEANSLASLKVRIRGAGNVTTFLDSQDYDAKGQRQYAKYGNGTISKYFYDPLTFRLINLITLQTAADANSQSIQNLFYTYDAVGNVVQHRDDAQQTRFFRNAVVRPESRFEYDALYQLIRATGREHASLATNVQRNEMDLPFLPQLPHQNDANAVRNYTEEYEYDVCGNIRALKHRAANASWTQRYRYEYEDDAASRTNRLKATSLPGDADGVFSAVYSHDQEGHITSMPHLPDPGSMQWNFMDQLKTVNLGGGGKAYYVYSQSSNRIRKIIERPNGKIVERIYLGAVEIYRERQQLQDIDFERYTLSVSDNIGRIAQIDTKTIDKNSQDTFNALNENSIRYQYGNHTGSATLETDEQGQVISYEEYHPYGTSSYRISRPDKDISLKRYRFSGKERDDETGFYYFGTRYYASWLGRWTSSDIGGFVDGLNLYRYCRNNPIMLNDQTGMSPELRGFNSRPQSINYTGTEQEVIDYFNNNRLIGTAEFVDDETGETFTRTMSVQLRVSGVTRVTDSKGNQFWQISDFSFVEGSGRLIDETDPPDEESEGPGGGGESGESGESGEPGDSSGSSGAGGSGEGDAGEGPDDVTVEGSDEGEAGASGTESGDRIHSPINPGSSAVSTHDSIHRGRYTSRNRAASRAARESIRRAEAAGDSVRSWEIAREASEGRNARRVLTQERLSPGGRAMSRAVDEGRSFGSSVAEYMERAPGSRTPAPTRHAATIADRVAEGVGRSNRIMTRLSKAGKVLGPVGIAVGVGIGAYNIYNAPEGERGRVIGEEVGNFVGGAVGFSAGMAAGVALAGGISGLLIGLGIISGPIGWLAIGLGLAIGALGAWAFGNVFSEIGGWIGGLFD